MKRLIGNFLAAALIVGALIAWVYLDFAAYRYRFPEAPTWTYFFGRN